MDIRKVLIPAYGRPRWKIYLLLGWTGMATGSCFLLITISWAGYMGFFLTHSTKTQAIVIANIEHEVPADLQTNTAAYTDYCPQFRYESSDGATHTVPSSTCSSPASFAIGDRVPVNYSNSNYDDAQIDSFGERWFLVVMFGSAALILLPIGFVLLRRVRLLGHSLDPIGYWDPD